MFTGNAQKRFLKQKKESLKILWKKRNGDRLRQNQTEEFSA